jgi:hypothetical protein
MVTLCLLLFSLDVLLPEEVADVSKMVRVDENLYFLDARAQVIWRVTNSGEADPVYDRRGSGPGEYQRLFGLRYFDERFFLTDMTQRKFIILNRDLSLDREIEVRGIPRDTLVLNNRYFLVYPKHGQGMIHSLGDEGGSRSFGKLLGDHSLFGFESGQVLGYGGGVWFIHHFMPRLEHFGPEGNLIGSHPIRGIGQDPLVTLHKEGNITRHRYRHVLTDLFLYKGKLLVKLHDHEEGRAWFYVFDPGRGQFINRFRAPWQMVTDGEEGMYLVHEEPESGRIRLKTITPRDEDLN